MVLRAENKCFKAQAKRSFKSVSAQQQRRENSAWEALGSLQRASKKKSTQLVINDEELQDIRRVSALRTSANETSQVGASEDDEVQREFSSSLETALATLYPRLLHSSKNTKVCRAYVDQYYACS